MARLVGSKDKKQRIRKATGEAKVNCTFRMSGKTKTALHDAANKGNIASISSFIETVVEAAAKAAGIIKDKKE